MDWLTGLFAAVLASLAVSSAHAQSVGGVFGPTVDADDQAFELRLALILNEGEQWGSIARLHYQEALNDSIRLRAVAQIADLPGQDLQFRHVQLEMLWQTVERTAGGYESGVRFDVRLPPQDDRANRFGVNWIHQWALGESWRVRAIARANAEFGPAGRDGTNLGFRSSLTRRLDSGLRLGVENFSRIGNTERGLGTLRTQRHSAGPMIRGPLTESWSWYASLQLGLTEAADDYAGQLRLTRTLQAP